MRPRACRRTPPLPRCARPWARRSLWHRQNSRQRSQRRCAPRGAWLSWQELRRCAPEASLGVRCTSKRPREGRRPLHRKGRKVPPHATRAERLSGRRRFFPLSKQRWPRGPPDLRPAPPRRPSKDPGETSWIAASPTRRPFCPADRRSARVCRHQWERAEGRANGGGTCRPAPPHSTPGGTRLGPWFRTPLRGHRACAVPGKPLDLRECAEGTRDRQSERRSPHPAALLGSSDPWGPPTRRP
mmetsp:Transcript_15174/g.57697  ORF Transcript_15174/g.57697 Transcript_15174/m.57697 type:complete len:242 (+) Transcript_15174:2346-3071(+)